MKTKEELKEYSRLYYLKNREKILLRAKNKNKKNNKKHNLYLTRSYAAKYYDNNREKINDNALKYYYNKHNLEYKKGGLHKNITVKTNVQCSF